jgi:glycerol-3-phosphate dehydrogenase
LIHEPGKETKEISRRDEVWVSQSGLVTIAGGKLTGYRKMAEDTVSKACQLLGPAKPVASKDTPLPGGDIAGSLHQFATNQSKKYLVSDEISGRLVRLYGSESEAVLKLGKESLAENGLVLRGEVQWAVEQEFALTLEDVLHRRTRAALFRPTELPELIEPAAEIMGDLLNWSSEKRLAEATSVRRRLKLDTEMIGDRTV